MIFCVKSPLLLRPQRQVCVVFFILLFAISFGGSEVKTLSAHLGKNSQDCDDEVIVRVAGTGNPGANGIYTCASISSGIPNFLCNELIIN